MSDRRPCPTTSGIRDHIVSVNPTIIKGIDIWYCRRYGPRCRYPTFHIGACMRPISFKFWSAMLLGSAALVLASCEGDIQSSGEQAPVGSIAKRGCGTYTPTDAEMQAVDDYIRARFDGISLAPAP